MTPVVNLLNVGRLGYIQGWKLQKYLVENMKKKILGNTLILTEHSPVYTVGIREKLYSVEEETKLKELGAEFYRTNRGGLITFHGPGQMVAYPIINLKEFKPSVRWYVSTLEQTIIELCSRYSIIAETSPYTGVWVKDSKICALGIHASSYITSHGLALNCNTDLTWFNHIIPCGIVGKTVTSLTQQKGKEISINEVLPSFIECFEKQFQCKIKYYNNSECDNILINSSEKEVLSNEIR